jgi:hypothetical protein
MKSEPVHVAVTRTQQVKIAMQSFSEWLLGKMLVLSLLICIHELSPS